MSDNLPVVHQSAYVDPLVATSDRELVAVDRQWGVTFATSPQMEEWLKYEGPECPVRR